MIACRDCLYFEPKKVIEYEKDVPLGHWGGLFKSKWVHDVGMKRTNCKTIVPSKCKRYPQHVHVDPGHECGECLPKE